MKELFVVGLVAVVAVLVAHIEAAFHANEMTEIKNHMDEIVAANHAEVEAWKRSQTR